MDDAPTTLTPFAELSAHELYDLLRLRSEVFVVEQDCVYQDLDGLDAAALHLRISRAGELQAYARLLAPGLVHACDCSIGRVVVSPRARGRGYGRRLVAEGISACRERWPRTDIVIHAQTYLLEFYGSLGFVVEGAGYLEDGIPHHTMRLRSDANAVQT